MPDPKPDGPSPGLPADHRLTPSHLRIAALVAEGLTNAEIAAKLDLAPLTVKSHMQRAMNRAYARNRAHLVCLLLQAGLLIAPPNGPVVVAVDHSDRAGAA